MKVRSWDTSTQKSLMAPHLQQNKSRVFPRTHVIWLPGCLRSWSSFLGTITLVALCSLCSPGSLYLALR